MIDITFLGTSGMVPTKERNLSAVFLSFKGTGILFDCAEGTQRQLKIAGIPITKVTHVCLSHWHGDHCLGLPGLIQSIGASNPAATLHVFGPPGTRERVRAMFDFVDFDIRVDLKVFDVTNGAFHDDKEFTLESSLMKHRVPCVGFAFNEKDRRRIDMGAVARLGIPEGPLLGKLQDGQSIQHKGKTISPNETTTLVRGKKIVFITDTVLTPNAYSLADGADLLICESSYAAKLADKAREYGHITAHDAASLAAKANVKRLALTHFSARYKNTQEIEEDARTVFDNVVCAKDFMRLQV